MKRKKSEPWFLYGSSTVLLRFFYVFLQFFYGSSTVLLWFFYGCSTFLCKNVTGIIILLFSVSQCDVSYLNNANVIIHDLIINT